MKTLKKKTRKAAKFEASDARAMRKREVTTVKRRLVLAAAESAFFDLGLEGASLRQIAKRAGYSPGAIYSYFGSKEEVYGALLGASLERLNQAISHAAAPVPAKSGAPQQIARMPRARAAASAFFGFYRDNPRDLDLGFYLFKGMQPRGLTPALNTRLNSRLRDALGPVHDELLEQGMKAAEAQAETTALFAHIVGLLLLTHTGRIRMFVQEPNVLFERYLDALLERAVAAGARSGLKRAPVVSKPRRAREV